MVWVGSKHLGFGVLDMHGKERNFVRVSEIDLAFFFMSEIFYSFRLRFFDFLSEERRGKGLFNIMLFCDVGL